MELYLLVKEFENIFGDSESIGIGMPGAVSARFIFSKKC